MECAGAVVESDDEWGFSLRWSVRIVWVNVIHDGS